MDITGGLRSRVRAGLSALGRKPALVPVLFDERVMRVLKRVPGAGALYGDGWHRQHPFDRENGTDTSGTVSTEAMGLSPADPAAAHAITYCGSQPSVIRAALAQVPAIASTTFLDLGCGKGRALLIATEFPFREIVGVELSDELVRVARANVAILRARFPSRPAVHIHAGDAAAFPLPAGDLIIFMYHPFRAAIMARIVAAIEKAIEDDAGRAIYVIYDNPIEGALLDASPKLTRRWARMVPHARSERGYAPEPDDAVMIWQGGAAPAPVSPAAARLIVPPGERATLAE